MLKGLFILLGLMCIYSYFLYPLILRLLPARRSVDLSPELPKTLPKLSLIITAHNEAGRIRAKLENTLEIQYPTNQLELIVASDCSTDGTDEIVKEYAKQGVRLVRADARKGKEYAQLCAIREAQGVILVFSDVATCIEPEALKKLAGRFDDAEIGAISSEDRFVSHDGSVVGEGAYVKYEMWLRRLESTRAGLVGLSGSFFAARREVCEQWDITVPSDFNTALNCAKLGLVAITCPNVVGIYQDVKEPALEYRRKTRTVIRGISAIASHPEVLNPISMRLFAFQIWSHKLMRWGVPWFMLSFLGISLMLVGKHWVFDLALLVQILFYAMVASGYLFSGLRATKLVKIPFFFVQVNLAIAHATLQFLGGKRITVWEPSKR